MRVGGVGVDGDDRRLVGSHPARRDPFEHETLNREFGAWQIGAHTPGNFREGLMRDLAQGGGGAPMAVELRGAERGFEALDEVGGSHHLDASRSRQSVEPMRLDRGDQRLRSAARRDEVEPSAGRKSMLGQSEDAVGERVAHAEVVEKPSVEFGFAQRLCDLFDSCHHAVAGGLKRAPQTWTRVATIRTIGLRSKPSTIDRYCGYLSRRLRSASMYSLGSSTTCASPCTST